MSAIETENILKFKAGYSAKKSLNLLKTSFYKDLHFLRLTIKELSVMKSSDSGDYKVTLCH